MRMRTVELGRTGQPVSQLALGCMIMGTATDEETSVRMLDHYVDAGGTFLDTADCYAWWHQRGTGGGQSESLLGRWLARRGRRDDVFVATKGSGRIRGVDEVWGPDGPDWDKARQRFEGAGADTLRRAIDDSLRRLGTDHVDLYYVHVDDRSTPLEETLEALAGVVAAGKARYVGWSNVPTWRMERIRQLCQRHGWPQPVAFQQQHSYLRRRPGLRDNAIVDEAQLDYLGGHDDVTPVAYSPILKGIYDDPARSDEHWIMESFRSADTEARLAAVRATAAELGVTPNQLVLAWLLHRTSPTIVPLVGPRTMEQYLAVLPALDLKLPDEVVARLDAAAA
jgi:aryl-alcohol dehydrogenase-like predicted oxidoreductase